MGYSYRTRQQRDLTSTVTSGVPRPARAEPPSRLRPVAELETTETADEPPAKMSQRDLQAVLDDAHEQGILEEPAKAAEVREQGVVAARIDTDDGEPVLVETVEPKRRKPRKAKAQK